MFKLKLEFIIATLLLRESKADIDKVDFAFCRHFASNEESLRFDISFQILIHIGNYCTSNPLHQLHLLPLILLHQALILGQVLTILLNQNVIGHE